MDNGVGGRNGNLAARHVIMASEYENGSVIILRPLMGGKLVQAVQRNGVYASLKSAILVRERKNVCYIMLHNLPIYYSL